MFVDEIKVSIKAGKGGDGIVSWLHQKGREFMGPSGGNGGNGGDVYILAISDIGRLARYRNIKEFFADDGKDGRRLSMDGGKGKDLTIELPVGSVITNLQSQKKYFLNEIEEKMIILSGGKGGYGNKYFKSSKNVSPKQFTKGKEGEGAEFLIELELIVDAGLIGLPNAGKSSLLNAITNANSKVGDFPFTTLQPNLGNLYGKILADIPGLIEGASKGKGLGFAFLKHIKRTKALVHCVSSEYDNPYKAYISIRKELEQFNIVFKERPELVVLTKSDLISRDVLNERLNLLKSHGLEVVEVSILNDSLVKNFSKKLFDFLSKI